jgi:hypothetical protein
MVNPRFRHGAEQGKQRAKGEKVAGMVRGVENVGVTGAKARFIFSPQRGAGSAALPRLYQPSWTPRRSGCAHTTSPQLPESIGVAMAEGTGMAFRLFAGLLQPLADGAVAEF